MQILNRLPLAPAIVATFLLSAMAALQAQDQSPASGDAADGAAAEETPMDEAAMEKAFLEHVETFGWQREGTGDLKDEAKIEIPKGFRFTGPDGAGKLMEVYGNPATGREFGLIAPEDLQWCVLFEFDKSGYVKDDEKDSIVADKLLATMRENQEMANEYRRENGLDELTITGWARPPEYNEQTNNLEWALTLASSTGGQTVNYNTRLLGRYGVMESVLICNPEDLDSVLQAYQGLIGGYSYKGGHTYAEYQDGDKIAKYGLAALIVGGGTAVAAKTGLLAAAGKLIAKGGKPIIIGIVALFAGIWAAFKRLFGKSE